MRDCHRTAGSNTLLSYLSHVQLLNSTEEPCYHERLCMHNAVCLSDYNHETYVSENQINLVTVILKWLLNMNRQQKIAITI